jgi:hypothetical protein
VTPGNSENQKFPRSISSSSAGQKVKQERKQKKLVAIPLTVPFRLAQASISLDLLRVFISACS